MRISAPVLIVLLGLAVQTAAPAARQTPAQGATPQPPAPPAAQGPAAPTAGEPPPGDATQPPRIRTGINYVRVDVIVTDKKGQPVLDLTPADFSLSEDGKPQAIEAFDVVKVDGVA
ncbi:MAG: hypothetical protein M3Q85_10890, partial [Acidobacteriota bacterium]|nr:hypothetical protein [Acidobacteriota bacterium]